jgi:NAD(P)H-hydrate epimerase
MRQVEAEAAKYGMSAHRLMENAGRAAAAFIRRTFEPQGLNCMIFCGVGNNGGDGLVVARKLIESGANVLVALVGGKPRSEEARAMYETVGMMGMPVLFFEQDYERTLGVLEKADIVVDAIYGTGFRGELDTWAERACVAINGAIAAVVSLDIPTGVECDTGRVADGAVNADFTVAFDSKKPAHVLPSSKPSCGEVEVADIGIPGEARKSVDGLVGDISTASVIKSLPKRAENSHKGSYGKLLVVAGSGRYRGAAALAVSAALRCGAGLVTLASVRPVIDAASAKLYECVYAELPNNDKDIILAERSIPLLREGLGDATAALFGCGVGLGQEAEKLLKFLVREARCPLVIDADGINALAANINILEEASAPVILTPHPGEMARLTGKTVAEIEQGRAECALTFAQEHDAHVVLKGPETVIASPQGMFLVNRTGNAGLAKAGSGDVLAGMIAAFAAQGLTPMAAAAAGVNLHGLAADEAAAELSQYAMLPSDLPMYLAKVLQKYQR